ncbi:MAG TPA: hypothetical protein VGO00_00730, partial [Kofleriaceae bacterium]|nr:hypothetical protein [Kofleriaceae bacterium]
AHLLVLPIVGASHWIDLRDRAETAGPIIAATSTVVVSPGASRAVAIDHEGAAFALVPGTRDRVQLGNDIALAQFLDEHRVALANRRGRIVVHDLATGTTAERCPERAGPRILLANADELAVVYVDAVTRVDAGGCHAYSLAGVRGAYLDRDSRLYLAIGSTLFAWPTNGLIAPHTVLPAPILGLLVFDDDHLGLDTEDAGYVVTTATPGQPSRTVHLGTIVTPGFQRETAWSNAAGERSGVLVIPGGGNAAVVDGTTGAMWSVDVPVSLLAGDVLIARHQDRVATLPLALPRSKLATLGQLGANQR